MIDWACPGTRRIVTTTDDPADVTDIASGHEAPAGGMGLSRDQVQAIESALADLYRTRVYPAITFCLRYQGQIVFDRAIGYARGHVPERRPTEDARRAAPDTPICLFSASKAIIGLLIHKLAEEEGIDLDAPVARYLPAFAGEGKARITVADVMTHRGGFPCFPNETGDASILTDWAACLERICNAPVESARRQPAYHAMTGGFVLGEIIQRVTGESVADYLDSRFRKPLGMRYFTYGLDGRSRSRVATNHVAGMPVRWPVSRWAKEALSLSFDDVVALSNQDLFMDAVIPSGNLYATAEELGRFYQMLLDDGVYEGRRVFKPETLARARAPAGRTWPDRMLKLPMRYSEGFMLGTSPVGLFGPRASQAYGHLGFMNILGWADPSRSLSCALLTTGKAVLGGHLIPLASLLTQINRHCRAQG